MNVTHCLRFDCEDSEDLGEESSWILLVVLLEWREQSENLSKLILGNRLDDELVVVAEEEETSTRTCTLTRSEDLISIEFRA